MRSQVEVHSILMGFGSGGPKPLTFTREQLLQAAEESGLKRIHSCCGVPDKVCCADQWQGNLEGFANRLLKIVQSK